jgi:transcriptional regulator with XRE-family HTH domain
MEENTSQFVLFLRDLLRRRKCQPSQLASEIGISHATVSRWLSGKDQPSAHSCLKLAEYSGSPLSNILSLIGLSDTEMNAKSSVWPEFREYAHKMYPEELDEDLITMIEDLIERRRQKKYNLRRNPRLGK